MKCSEVQELLSAYYDNELSNSTRATVREHIEECSACQAELGQFEGLSSLASELVKPTMPDSAWSGIVEGLNSDLEGGAQSESIDKLSLRDLRPQDERNASRLSRRRLLHYAAALAATLVLGFLGMELWMHGDHDHAEMAKAMEQVADEINSDEATHLLLKKYGGSEVNYQDAITQVGYTPVASKGLPAGYSVESVQVLDMPCCKCTQTACLRPDNSRFFIFEHSNASPGWFNDKQKRQCNCGNKACEIIELDDQLAATWEQDNRHITVIGARDQQEIELLVNQFEKIL